MTILQLRDLNNAIERDERAFITARERAYRDSVTACADSVLTNLYRSPIILLAGPSGSAKTTTANRIRAALEQRGVKTHMISLDDYYLDFSPEAYPKTETGEPDLESPLGLDIPLLNQQMEQLAKGEEILVPRFDFTVHARDRQWQQPLQLHKDEAVVFEGLHALNPMFTNRHPDAFRLYVSTQTDLYDGQTLLLPHEWTRLLRRCVRDMYHRNSPIEETLSLWSNVRRGDHLFIRPFSHLAHRQIDSSLYYEWPALGSVAAPLFRDLSPAAPESDTIQSLCGVLQRIAPVSLDLIPRTSLLREEFLQS